MSKKPIAVLFAAVLIHGCVGLHGYESVEALRADALAVFKEHNQTASESMLVLPELDLADPAAIALADADAAMLLACEPLNELAIAHREGKKTSLRQRSQLPATIDSCRQATHKTRLVLNTISTR